MRVILLKPVAKVGKPEDVVEVSEGFARNSLFPRKLAIPATPAHLQSLERKQSGRATEKAVRRTLLDSAIQSTSGKSFVMEVSANEQGSLFSKIHATDIAKYLLDVHRLDLDPACIVLPEKSIKKLGTYDLELVDGTYKATISIEVIKK